MIAKVLAAFGVLAGNVLVMAAPAQAAPPPCGGTTQHFVSPGVYTYLPTTAQHNGDRDCVLGPGSAGLGVFALEEFSLRRCHNSRVVSASPHVYDRIAVDTVRLMQAAAGIRAEGRYASQTRAHAVRFTLFSADTGQPILSAGGGYRCQLVR
jgi:hypothetical protein